MPSALDLEALDAPLIAAPMAGGPSTPELVSAVTNAGGLGTIPGGLLSADALAQSITAARNLTTGPVSVNLFVPQQTRAGTAETLAAYGRALAAEAKRYNVELGQIRLDDEWAAKLDVVLDMRPEAVSFTFGVPAASECSMLRGVGITTVGTVTAASEARVAIARGVDALVVQGPSAGGHRATFDPATRPASEPLAGLLGAIVTKLDVPVVAAGGLATAEDIAAALSAGAVAAQLGTAFLLADEAGTHPVHRAAIRSDDFPDTALTRAFTGRYARGLRNRFIDDHDAQAPSGFPEVAQMTAPFQQAAARRGDPGGMALWAGTEFRKARSAPAADIVHELV